MGRGGVTHRDGRRRLQVDDTAQVWPGGVDRGVRREARTVHPEVRRARVDDAARHVDLDEVRGRDLVVQHAVRDDQEVLLVLVDTTLHETMRKC